MTMANVDKQKQKQEQQENKERGQELQRREPQAELAHPERAPFALRDPFELMRDFMRWDPFRWDPFTTPMLWRDPFSEMRAMMRDLWSGVPERRERVWRPEFDVRETDDAYLIRADVPGISADDVEVNVTGDQLQISGQREHKKEETEGEYRTYERAYGSFARTFTIPDEVEADHIHCKLDNGVLDVVLPKKPGAKPSRRKIEVKSGPSESH
jgi:HSP20 family protein